jgi:hypothetical protein
MLLNRQGCGRFLLFLRIFFDDVFIEIPNNLIFYFRDLVLLNLLASDEVEIDNEQRRRHDYNIAYSDEPSDKRKAISIGVFNGTQTKTRKDEFV